MPLITMHIRSTVACLLAVSLAIAVTSVKAGTYYVATDGQTSGDGSSSNPWPTVSHALWKVGGGHTILLKPGMYTAPIGISATYSGTSAAPTVIKSESKWQARIVGSNSQGIYTAANTQWLVIDGF